MRRQPRGRLAQAATAASGAVPPATQADEPQRASSKPGGKVVSKVPGQVSEAQMACLRCVCAAWLVLVLDPPSLQRRPRSQPATVQQTLRRSFIVGGIGLHTGEYAVVRVAPAFAGEGRYFVRVPPGAISPLWDTERPTATQLDGAWMLCCWPHTHWWTAACDTLAPAAELLLTQMLEAACAAHLPIQQPLRHISVTLK